MPSLELTWDDLDGVAVDEYRVYTRRLTDPASRWEDVPAASTRGTTALIQDRFGQSTMEFGIAPVIAGVEFPEDDWTVVQLRPDRAPTDLAGPSDVTAFAVEQAEGDVLLRWDRLVGENVAFYEIRHGASWEAGIVDGRVGPDLGSARFAWWASGSTTYFVRAQDSFGRWSENPTSAAVDIEDEAYFPVQGTHDEHAAGYTGTKTGVEVNGGNLEPEVWGDRAYELWTAAYETYTDPWWHPYRTDATYETPAQDAGLVVTERVEVDIAPELIDAHTSQGYETMLVPYNPPENMDGSPAGEADVLRHPCAQADVDLKLLGGIPVLVEIDTTPDDPAGTPTWDGWRPWVPGGVYSYRGVRLRFTWTGTWPYKYVRYTGMTWRRTRLNRKDETTVTVSATGGTPVVFGQAFTEAPRVTGSVQHPTLVLEPIFSAVTALGCDVHVYDPGGIERDEGDVIVHALGV